MLKRMKLGTVKVAFLLTLAASAFAVANAQAEIQIPLETSDEGIQTAVSSARSDGNVRTMMNEVRAKVIVDMSANMPLIDTVKAKMMPMMMNKIMNVQMAALKNPEGGIPGSIAPPPF